MQKKISKFFIRLENSSLFEKRTLIKIHFYKYLIVSSLGKTSIDFSVDDFNSLKKAILLPKSYMKKPNLLGYSIHIERYRITSAFGFNNSFEILTNSKTLNFLSKIKTLLTHVIDPSKSFYYGWLIVISLAIIYNYIFIIGRTSFSLLQNSNVTLWLVLDYLCDFIYLLDIGVRFRTGYLFTFHKYILIRVFVYI